MKKVPRSAIWMLGFLLFLAVFRDILANGRPLYCRIGGVGYWPGLRTIYADPNKPFDAPALRNLQLQYNQLEVWKTPSNFDEPPIYAPIPFSPGESSVAQMMPMAPPGSQHTGLPPRFKHWLGSDANGRDVAATLVSGARISILTGSLAMLVALLIGLTLGMVAGFFGDDRLKATRGQIIMLSIGFAVAFFLTCIAKIGWISSGKSVSYIIKSLFLFISILLIFNYLGSKMSKNTFLSKPVVLPIDMLIMRVGDVFSSLPRLILLIVMAVAFQELSGDPIWLMIGLIGALSWTGIAQLVRAELLRIRALDFVSAARGLGLSEWRVLTRHALPNAMRPIFIAFAFGAGGAVLLESYLSFLGYGGQGFKGISWGSLFGAENSSANPLQTWWVTLFPGMMIFILVLSLNRIGDALSDRA